jgi:hypothetical protein
MKLIATIFSMIILLLPFTACDDDDDIITGSSSSSSGSSSGSGSGSSSSGSSGGSSSGGDPTLPDSISVSICTPGTGDIQPFYAKLDYSGITGNTFDFDPTDDIQMGWTEPVNMMGSLIYWEDEAPYEPYARTEAFKPGFNIAMCADGNCYGDDCSTATWTGETTPTALRHYLFTVTGEDNNIATVDVAAETIPSGLVASFQPVVGDVTVNPGSDTAELDITASFASTEQSSISFQGTYGSLVDEGSSGPVKRWYDSSGDGNELTTLTISASLDSLSAEYEASFNYSFSEGFYILAINSECNGTVEESREVTKNET